jgi:hypothetical protein
MMFCLLFFFYNFSVNPPPFVFPSDSLHQLVPGMTQQKVGRSATLSIWSCRAPPTGRPGKGGRLYGNQWFSLHSPCLVPVYSAAASYGLALHSKDKVLWGGSV